MKRLISNNYIKIAILILVLVLIFLTLLFIAEYQTLPTKQLNHPLRSLLANMRQRGPLTVQDINYMATWMTFDYINHLFNLPQNYLKTQLMIVDPRYPLLTINRYAQSKDLVPADVLNTTKNTVRIYLTQPQQ